MRIIIAILIIFLLHITAIGQNNPAASEKVQAKINLLETWLNETIDYYHIPGLVIGVVYDQNLVWSDAFGYANLETKEKMTDRMGNYIKEVIRLLHESWPPREPVSGRNASVLR